MLYCEDVLVDCLNTLSLAQVASVEVTVVQNLLQDGGHQFGVGNLPDEVHNVVWGQTGEKVLRLEQTGFVDQSLSVCRD